MRFNLRHIQFAEEYLRNGGDASKAYRDIYGCATQSSYTLGPKLLDHPDIQHLLREGKRKAMKNLEITAERVIQELACIAFFDVEDIYDDQGNMRPLSEIPEEARRAIVSIDPVGEFAKRAKIEGKRGALHLLGQTMALFIEKKLVEGEHTHRVQVDEVDLEDRISNITGEGEKVDPFA